jgi:hypothetical protein
MPNCITALHGNKFPIFDWLFYGSYDDTKKFIEGYNFLDEVYDMTKDITQEVMNMGIMKYQNLGCLTVNICGDIYRDFKRFGEDPSAYGSKK